MMNKKLGVVLTTLFAFLSFAVCAHAISIDLSDPSADSFDITYGGGATYDNFIDSIVLNGGSITITMVDSSLFSLKSITFALDNPFDITLTTTSGAELGRASSVAGMFDFVALGLTDLTIRDNGENTIITEIEVAPVPEPATLLLLGGGLVGLFWYRRNRNV